jgi:cystathionine beta-synthase
VVAILPDSGRIYLSKFHSTEWLRRMGFLDDDRPGLLRDAVGAVRTVTTRTPLAEAVAAGAGQPIVPVVQPGRDPRGATAVSEILGTLDPAVTADRPRRRASSPGRRRSRWARGRPRRRPSPASTPRAPPARCCCATAASRAW